MCDPVSLSLIAGGVSGVGAYQSGQFEAEIAEFNQGLATRQRRFAIQRGEDAVERVREQARAIIGQQAVGYATQGLALDVGSPLEVGADTAAQAARAVTTVRNNAMLEAWGYKMQALDFGLREKEAKKGGLAGLAGGVLGGLGQAFG